MTGGVAIEHSHRLLAMAVGFATIVLAFKLARENRWKLGASAVALVLVQGLLGGLTVLYRLPDLISTAHLGVSMLFLVLLVYVSTTTMTTTTTMTMTRWQRWSIGLSTVAIYLQILLGALVRHTESGLACSGWLLCHGSLWPNVHPSARLHMAHRFGALVVAAFIIVAARSAWCASPRLARSLVALLVMQVALGLASVRTGLALWAVEGHLAVGAALLCTSTLLWLLLQPSNATQMAT